MTILQVITAGEEKTAQGENLCRRAVPCKICALGGFLTIFKTLLQLDGVRLKMFRHRQI